MSELRVDTIKPSFNAKVVITPGFVVRDNQDTDQFEVTASGETKVFGPLNVGSIVSHTPGTAGQLLSSQGAGLPPVWVPAIPFGGIIMWYGSVPSIPAGWVLCDGVTRTILGESWTPPDLRDRFVVGAGTTYSVNQTGGNKDAVVVAHTHSATDDGSFADHRHMYLLDDNTQGAEPSYDNIRVNTINNGGADGGGVLVANLTSKPKNASNNFITNLGVTVASAGESGVNKNLPPFYALCYIMRVPTQ